MYFDFNPEYCMLSVESATYNVILYKLTRPSIEPTFYHTGGEQANHYTTDAALIIAKYLLIIWKTF